MDWKLFSSRCTLNSFLEHFFEFGFIWKGIKSAGFKVNPPWKQKLSKRGDGEILLKSTPLLLIKNVNVGTPKEKQVVESPEMPNHIVTFLLCIMHNETILFCDFDLNKVV